MPRVVEVITSAKIATHVMFKLGMVIAGAAMGIETMTIITTEEK